MVSNPDLRDKFEKIELRSKEICSQEIPDKCLRCNGTRTLMTPGGEVLVGQHFYVRDHWMPNRGSPVAHPWSQTEALVRWEVSEYENSPELYHTILTIFLELKYSESLHEIVLTSAFDVLLQALEASAFVRRIAKVAVTQKGLLDGDFERTWNGVIGNTSFLHSASIEGPYHKWQAKAPIPYPSFISIVEVTRMVAKLELKGCSTCPPFHRVCFGCQEFWMTCFYRQHYPNLQSLYIHNMFMDSFQLRSFLKKNGGFLATLHISQVKLTSSSWSKVLKSVSNAPINYLRFGALFEKHSEGENRGWQVFGWHKFAQVSEGHVRAFLAHMIDNPGYLHGRHYREVALPAGTNVVLCNEIMLFGDTQQHF
jgi:hypothetical protein